MQFESLADFWAMGGYAFYVWLSFGVALLAMLVISAISALEHKQLMKQIIAEQQRKIRIQRAQQQASASSSLSNRKV